jgi:CubicO group peptidase (beta-lactamase class C family)
MMHMQTTCRWTWLIVIGIALSSLAACSSGGGDGAKARIEAVEQGLVPAVVATGSVPAGMRLADRMQHYLVPGVSIAVINDGQIEWARGYGVTEEGGAQAVDADTVFQACSVSKPVSVTGMMLLAQSGTIDVTRDVNDYLTSWSLADNEFTATEKATVERLMSHTGGTNVSGFGGYPAGSAVPTLLQVLDGSPPANSEPIQVVYVPGSHSSYSGGGMEVLHQMVEDVTGQPFRTYMQENLLARLGMTSSDYVQPLEGPLLDRAAKGHDVDGTALPGGWNTYPELIAAGLWTTPSDLSRVILEVQRAATADQGAVLSQETAQQILTQRPNSSFGLGFAVKDGSSGLIFQHTGSNFGYKSFILGYRDRGQGVAVMTNGDNGFTLTMEIARAVATVYGWSDLTPEEADLVEVPSDALASYAGEFQQVDGTMTFQVYVSDAGLMLKFTGILSERLDLYPLGMDRFLTRSQLPGTLTFTKDGAGNVTGFSLELQEGGTITAARGA